VVAAVLIARRKQKKPPEEKQIKMEKQPETEYKSVSGSGGSVTDYKSIGGSGDSLPSAPDALQPSPQVESLERKTNIKYEDLKFETELGAGVCFSLCSYWSCF
jgi:hypothetical protein